MIQFSQFLSDDFVFLINFLSSEENESSLVGHLVRHKGPVCSSLLLWAYLLRVLIVFFVLLHICSVCYWNNNLDILIFQVRGLEFNTIAPNLLASGAEDGEICIWDLANPSEPTHFPPLKVRIFFPLWCLVTLTPSFDGLICSWSSNIWLYNLIFLHI
jgi:WD40 repeat protein